MGGPRLARRVEPRLSPAKQTLAIESATADQDARRRLDDALVRVEATIAGAIECEEPLLRRMVADLVSAGGKRLRPRITLLAFDACGGADFGPVVDAAA